ncbi:MAG: hypothetical protein ACFE8J_17715 [Candidatus Heimdallarchaeota archaeon]
MGAGKNLFKGIIFMGIYIVITMVIPYFTFTWIKDLSNLGIPIILEQQEYESIIFWISAFGLLISSLAFFSYSSPKQSIRKGVFALLQILVNSLYIWSYKFSGAADILFQFEASQHVNGYLFLNFQNMIMIYLGIYFLTIVLKSYDLIDFIVNREKIREKRYGIRGGYEKK